MQLAVSGVGAQQAHAADRLIEGLILAGLVIVSFQFCRARRFTRRRLMRGALAGLG